jgi:hypothetical protein
MRQYGADGAAGSHALLIVGFVIAVAMPSLDSRLARQLSRPPLYLRKVETSPVFGAKTL